MPKRRRVLRSDKVVKILTKHFKFCVIKQKGSHIKCQKIIDNRKVTTIVPNHKELAVGTLRGILDLAEIKEEDFLKAIKK